MVSNTISTSFKLYFAVFLGLVIGLATATLTADPLPAQKRFADQSLQLNGKGTRSKFFIDLYDAGLYLQAPSSDPKAIITSTDPMALRLHITSSRITSDNMEEAVREGFAAATNNNVSALSSRIEQLIETFRQPINVGDVYDFIYLHPDTLIVKNGNAAGVISGNDFKQALFGIWLGDAPAQNRLKQDLLGQ